MHFKAFQRELSTMTMWLHNGQMATVAVKFMKLMKCKIGICFSKERKIRSAPVNLANLNAHVSVATTWTLNLMCQMSCYKCKQKLNIMWMRFFFSMPTNGWNWLKCATVCPKFSSTSRTNTHLQSLWFMRQLNCKIAIMIGQNAMKCKSRSLYAYGHAWIILFNRWTMMRNKANGKMKGQTMVWNAIGCSGPNSSTATNKCIAREEAKSMPCNSP